MYYENKKQKNFGIALIIIFLSIIIFLLFRISYGNEYYEKSNYDAKVLSTANEQNVENSSKNNAKDIINKAIKSVVGISKIEENGTTVFIDGGARLLGLGSGIIVSDNGYILTNEHVSGKKFSKCYVTTEDGNKYVGDVVWSNSNLDLAIVKIDGYYLEYLNLGDSDEIYLGQDVYAIGNPIGFEFQRTVTKGIISGINRTIRIDENDTSSYMEDLIQTDATINEGNSGGPLIDEDGKLLGVTSIKISSAEGVGFAVPINVVKPIIEKFIKTGKFEESYLGIYGYDKEVIPYLDEKLEIDTGIYIAKILSDSPLISAGIREKDIIVKIDEENINKMNDLKKYIYNKNPKDKVTLTINRNGIEFMVQVTLSTKIN